MAVHDFEAIAYIKRHLLGELSPFGVINGGFDLPEASVPSGSSSSDSDVTFREHISSGDSQTSAFFKFEHNSIDYAQDGCSGEFNFDANQVEFQFPVFENTPDIVDLLSPTPMALIYSCKECGANLSLNTIDLFPPDHYFDACNKNTLSFARVDPSKLRFEKEDKIRPFFESLNYWGIHRNRTVIKCNACGRSAMSMMMATR